MKVLGKSAKVAHGHVCSTGINMVLPSVKVDAFSKIMRPSLGKLIREVDAMLRPGGVLYVGFQSIATFCS